MTSKGHNLLVGFAYPKQKLYKQKVGKHYKFSKCVVVDISFLLEHLRSHWALGICEAVGLSTVTP